MNDNELKTEIRSFFDSYRGSNLDAYIGLYRVRESDNRDPEGCMYVRMAWNHFLDSELKGFREHISRLNKILEGK